MLSASYRSLLRTPGAAAFFLSATLGRVGIAMTGLGIIWLVHGRTDSYAVAGLVTGAFAVAEALAGPQLARLVDRFGQTRVLPPLLLAHTAAMASLVALAGSGGPHGPMAAAGAFAGATVPQLGALSAARWTALLQGDRPEALPSAFALESLGNGLCYLAGPALVTTVGVRTDPAHGVALATTLVVGGGLALAAQRRTAPATAGAAERRRAGRSLLRPGFAAQVGVNLALGLYFGATQVSVTAFAVGHGAAGAAAPLYAVSNGASLLAGWVYGLRRWRGAPRVQLAWVTGGAALGSLPLLAAGSVRGLGLALAVTGLAVPPILVLSSVLTAASVDGAALTQAFTWLNSASAAGAAGAAALAGRAVDAHGPTGGFALAAAATTAMALVAAADAHATGRRRPARRAPAGRPCGSQPRGSRPRGSRPRGGA
ncbi:MFS transporter [Streptomyces liangshanensis]|uniref:MFS transporter n=1 Tax=Streptomyces liangshanensis TaxID=2717324 RepID=UPI001FB8C847|nr:MFS transporter [Streptomyces liangshanensis]